MRVCFFGNYQRDYPRNQVLLSGLKKNHVFVLECRTRDTGWKKYWSLFMRHRQLAASYDVMLVAFSGFSVMWFARLVTRKPIVFDAFVSLYLTNVEDRKICRPGSLRAWRYWLLDYMSCALATRVLLDTQAQIDYFTNRYHLPREKFERIFVGADDSIYFPNPQSAIRNPQFIVHWHGHIVPFHGLQTVIEAAQLLVAEPDITFRIVTRFNAKYQTVKDEVARRGLGNIKFLPEQEPPQLAKLMNEADVCLGIFGDNQKSRVVIPNKIFEAIACAKPVVTARHEAMLELFTDKQNILLVDPKNARQLADKILLLKNDDQLRRKLIQAGYKLYRLKLTPEVLGRELVNVFDKLFSAKTASSFGKIR